MLTVGNNSAGVESLLGDGLLSCPCCGGGWAAGVTRSAAGFHGGPFPGGGPSAAGAVCSCGVTHVLLPAWLLSRRCDGDGGDRGDARAGRAGSGVPVDRGCVGGSGRYGAGQAAPVPRVGGAGAGVLYPAGRGLGGGSGAAGAGGRRLGDAVVAVAAAAAAARDRWPGRSRCRRGSWRPWSRWGRFCPRSVFRAVPGTCAVCPGVTVQRELPSAWAAACCHSRRAREGRRPRRDKA